MQVRTARGCEIYANPTPSWMAWEKVVQPGDRMRANSVLTGLEIRATVLVGVLSGEQVYDAQNRCVWFCIEGSVSLSGRPRRRKRCVLNPLD